MVLSCAEYFSVPKYSVCKTESGFVPLIRQRGTGIDLKDLFDDFHHGKLDISRLNYGIISLVPKTKDANQIKKRIDKFVSSMLVLKSLRKS